MQFEFFRFRFRFRAEEPVVFPAGQSGNILRGTFGAIFRRIACLPDCPGPASCRHRGECAYARVFEPRPAFETGPSGLKNWPRPFVFRASHLDGLRLEPGSRFHFDAHLFDLGDPPLPYFLLAFAELAREGIGPRRGRAALLGVEQWDRDRMLQANVPPDRLLPPVRIPLEPDAGKVRNACVRFVTPTELKSGERVAERPEFAVLFARARDRVSTLRALYGPGPLDIDFQGMGERASRVRMTHCDLHPEYVERRSSRTGQTHRIGGLIGQAVYEGELEEFLPYLRAARWTGVGRHTVWGNGVIETDAAG
ncbi:MAG: CRISPR system precrRNA processing endoribonuclease RAMP protein Cas6 [Bryobacterales bacterium]|nr:CRISPR system precrRNA processing endoribonuclease RAMP protein Cas6 [Bryobacterales bacterium]